MPGTYFPLLFIFSNGIIALVVVYIRAKFVRLLKQAINKASKVIHQSDYSKFVSYSTIASLNPWGKLDEVQNERLMARRKTRKRIAFIAISSIVLVSIIVGAVVGGVSYNNNKSSQQNDNVLSISSTIRAVCNLTLYPDSCISSLSPYATKFNALKPQDIYKMSVLVALNELFGASDKFFKSETFKNINNLNINKEH
ncbi:putative pectinesterase/pectinesterase inhibitor 24 [Capsicum galapagoense]